MINIKQNLSSIFSILKLVTIIMFLMSLSIADPLHLTQGKHTRPWNPKIKNLPPSHFFHSDLSSQVHCNFLFFLSLHYGRGHFKSKSYSSCKFYGHPRTPQETLILRKLWKFQRYEEKKKTWLPMFTQLSPKKEIAKKKPNTPKVLFNNERTLY